MKVLTRQLIKQALFDAGWRRMTTRPKDYQEVLVAQEWLDRKDGTTSQFLISFGEYDATNDQILCSDDGTIRAVHIAKKFHWWMPVFTPDNINMLHLRIGNYLQVLGTRVAYK
jgi:hypothetical protein